MYLSVKLHFISSNGLLVFAIKLKAEENFIDNPDILF
jgi:hypothetical protein